MSSTAGWAEGQRRRRGFLVAVLAAALVGVPAAVHTTEASAATSAPEACGIPAASTSNRSLAQNEARAHSSPTGTRSGAGREPLVLFLLALAVTFALTRIYTRRARVAGTGGFRVGGVHVHHLVFGIVIALSSGLVAIATSPGSTGREVLAIAFGAGAALTLDEFALWFHLSDVYWRPEGRSSIEATMLGGLLGVLLLLGPPPYVFDAGVELAQPVVVALVAVNVALALVCLLKGKFGVGLVAVFVPFAGLAPAVRLAKPRSLWSEWFYASTPQTLARARSRYGDGSEFERLRRLVADAIGGAPSFPALDVA